MRKTQCEITGAKRTSSVLTTHSSRLISATGARIANVSVGSTPTVAARPAPFIGSRSYLRRGQQRDGRILALMLEP